MLQLKTWNHWQNSNLTDILTRMGVSLKPEMYQSNSWLQQCRQLSKPTGNSSKNAKPVGDITCSPSKLWLHNVLKCFPQRKTSTSAAASGGRWSDFVSRPFVFVKLYRSSPRLCVAVWSLPPHCHWLLAFSPSSPHQWATQPTNHSQSALEPVSQNRCRRSSSCKSQSWYKITNSQFSAYFPYHPTIHHPRPHPHPHWWNRIHRKFCDPIL